MSHGIKYWYDKGKQDYPHYDPPHDIIAETIPIYPGSDEEAREAREENEAYNRGYQNARKQAEKNR